MTSDHGNRAEDQQREDRRDGEPLPDGIVEAGEQFGVGNEFTGVLVRKVWTRQGERLELVAPRHGYRILLDAMQLEIVAAQQPEQFTSLFATQLGAESA